MFVYQKEMFSCTPEEHAAAPYVYHDYRRGIVLRGGESRRRSPGMYYDRIPKQTGAQFPLLYVDLFALRFSVREQVNVLYGCQREVRDEILFLQAEQVFRMFRETNCHIRWCQYYYLPRPGLPNCILARTRGEHELTLEEIGRLFNVTREWIRRGVDETIVRARLTLT